MKKNMDAAVLETYGTGPSRGSSDIRFVHDLVTEQVGDDVRIEYIIYEDNHGTTLSSVTDEGNRFTGSIGPNSFMTVRPPVPDDAIIMSPDAGVAQPIEAVYTHIQKEGGILAPALEAIVDAINDVLAVILRTGLGVYFRENGVWQMKRVDPRLTEGTTLQILAPDALQYWDDMGDEASIYDLPYMVNGERIDPSMRAEANGPAEDDEEEVR